RAKQVSQSGRWLCPLEFLRFWGHQRGPPLQKIRRLRGSSLQERFSYCISCSRTDIWCFFGPTIGHWVRQPVQPLAVVIADARLEFSLEAKLADRRAAESELGGDLFHG